MEECPLSRCMGSRQRRLPSPVSVPHEQSLQRGLLSYRFVQTQTNAARMAKSRVRSVVCRPRVLFTRKALSNGFFYRTTRCTQNVYKRVYIDTQNLCYSIFISVSLFVDDAIPYPSSGLDSLRWSSELLKAKLSSIIPKLSECLRSAGPSGLWRL